MRDKLCELDLWRAFQRSCGRPKKNWIDSQFELKIAGFCGMKKFTEKEEEAKPLIHISANIRPG